MPGRVSNTNNYRYAYNGIEQDPEVKGNGNSYTTQFRQYDPRIGRWLSLDPKMSSMPWQSPYCAMDNNPILHNDPLGDSVRYERFGDRLNVFFKSLGNKDFKSDHQARKFSSDIYTYRRSENEPDLGNARERTDLSLPTTMDGGSLRRPDSKDYVSVLYDKYGMGGTQDNPSPIQINLPTLSLDLQYDIKPDRKKGEIQTPIASNGNPTYGPYTFNSPNRWVPGTNVNFRSATQPDNFTFTDQNGANIVQPFTIVQGSTLYGGVTNTNNAWLSVPTSATVTSWTVSVTSQHYWTTVDVNGNATGRNGFPSSVFYIEYQKYKFFPSKINISLNWGQ